MVRTVMLAAVVAALAALLPAPARADSTCTDADRARETREAQKAEDLERAGRTGDAIKAMEVMRNSECLPTAGHQRLKAAWARATRALGEQAEKAGQFEQASGYYFRGEHLADADRAMRKHAQAHKTKAESLETALNYFEKRQDASAQSEVRGLAEAAGNQWLQAEEKTFAGGRLSSLPDLESARPLLRLVGPAAERRAVDRALQRGDAMAKGSTPRALEFALGYYAFADQRDKAEAIKPIARRHGDAAAKRGEHRIAEQFYALSGDDAKIDALEKSRERSEAQRQKDFKKGADDLERALKM